MKPRSAGDGFPSFDYVYSGQLKEKRSPHMKKIERLYISNFPTTDPLEEVVKMSLEKINELIDAHNELLETHTVKEEGELMFWARDHYWDSLEREKSMILKHLESFRPTSPSNSEKEDGCSSKCRREGICEKCAFSEKEEAKEEKEILLGEDRSDGVHVKLFGYRKDGVVYVTREEVKEQPTTPETKVKISCPDCPHEETNTPEKKCCENCNGKKNQSNSISSVCSGHCLCHKENLPTSSYEVTCGRCEKSIKHSCGRV